MKKIFISFFLLLWLMELQTQVTVSTYNENTLNNFFEKVLEDDTLAVKNYLINGVNINASTYEGVTALMFATIDGNYDMARMLILRGADVNRSPYDGKSPLMEAAQQELIEIGELLILNKAAMQQKDKSGRGAIHYAVMNGNYYFTEMLLFYEDSIEFKTKEGSTPLILASLLGDSAICNLLLGYGASVNSTDNNGFTPLMCAAQEGHENIVKLLLENGANHNTLNSYGHNALCYAVKSGNIELANELLDYGADLQFIMPNGHNLIYLAESANQYEMKKHLKELGLSKSKGFSFNYFYLKNGINFTNRDAMYTCDFGLMESQSNIYIGIVYYKRIGYVPVIENDNEIIYQFFENRSLIGFSQFKYFTLYEISNVSDIGIGVGLQEDFTYGKYRGLDRNPRGKLLISPMLNFYYRKGFWNTGFKYQYLKADIPHFPVSRFEIQLGLEFPLKNNTIKEKYMIW